MLFVNKKNCNIPFYNIIIEVIRIENKPKSNNNQINNNTKNLVPYKIKKKNTINKIISLIINKTYKRFYFKLKMINK